MVGLRKTVYRHNSLNCCACSCVSGQVMILYNQLIKLEFYGVNDE